MNIGFSGRASWLAILAGCLALLPLAQAEPKHVLVVTTTMEYYHSSIPTAEKTLAELAAQSGTFDVDFASLQPAEPRFKGADGKFDKAKFVQTLKELLANKMSAAALKRYDAVVFANTSGELPLPEPQALLDWLRAGKGFVGMHSAADTFHGFPPYLKMLGAEFLTHGGHVEVEAANQNPECSACTHLAARWKVCDEIYLFQNFNRSRVRGLLGLDQHPYDNTPGDYPISWYKGYGKGRVFYTSLGHREDVWDPDTPASFARRNSKEVARAYRQHILKGIEWALGLETWEWNAKPTTTPAP